MFYHYFWPDHSCVAGICPIFVFQGLARAHLWTIGGERRCGQIPNWETSTNAERLISRCGAKYFHFKQELSLLHGNAK